MSDNPGYVYVIHNAVWPGWVKVGRVFGTSLHVDNIMRSRVSSYNTADPHKGFVVARSSYAACAVVAESYAHELLAVHHARGHGEWFKCPEEKAKEIVETACTIARLRPRDRKKHFEAALEKERNEVELSDTHKIMLRMIEEDAAKPPKKVDVTETARAAHAVIETLLSQMAMPDENTEAAARAVLRRLDALGGGE